MILGRQPQGRATTAGTSPQTVGRGRRLGGVRWLLAAFLFVPVIVATAGCGGSSSSGPGTVSINRNASVTGRIVDQYSSNAPVAGAHVTFGAYSTTTSTDGTFVIAVGSRQPATQLYVTGPDSASYYNTGYVNGQPFDLRNTGVTVPSLEAEQTYSTGDITILSASGPPPPPIF